MNIRTRKFTAVLSLLGSVSAFLMANTGFAQNTPSKAPAANAPKEDTLTLEKFEVTGSLIKVSELVGPSPIDVISDRTIEASGVTDTTQLLKRLNPGFMGNGNQSTERNNGGGGEAYIALRNLTTLVLVNGRRIASSPYSSGTSVDLNTIPLSMIDHIEILKDGASTAYGSDAIAGVVNLLLRKNYNGFETRARYGFTNKRDYTTRGASIFGGVSKDGSSLTVGVDTFKNDQLSSTARALPQLDAKTLVALGGTAALPSYYSTSFAGRVGNDVIAGAPLAVGAPGYKAGLIAPPAKTNPNAPAQTLAQLEAAGIYVPISTTQASKDASGSTAILNTTQFGTASIVPTDRRQVVLNGEHEIYGKSLVAFADALYSQTINRGTVLAPSPLSSVGGNKLIIPANNPYNLFGILIGVGGVGDPGVRTRLEEVGNRARESSTDTYRLVTGLKGDINENYSWQVDGTYSRAGWIQRVYGGASGAVMNSLLTPLTTAGGTAYVYDSAGKPLSAYVDSNGNNLPVYDYFSAAGANDPRDIAAMQTVLFQSGTTELTQGNLLFRGTPFNLPAGKLGFAIGGEYRKEEIATSVDGLFAQGLALGYGAANTFAGGKRSTKSASIEFDVPIFGGSYRFPGAYLLNLDLAGRYEKLSTGETSKVPKVGIKWQPLDRDLSIRGTYAKGFIAPAIYNLYGPAGVNAPTFTLLEGTNTSPGGSTGRLVTGQWGGTITELSNPTLKASASVSRTFGVVYSPKALKGLTVSTDYYFIKQDHVGGIDYTSIYADLNKNGSASPYAATFQFVNGSKLTSTAPNQVTNLNAGLISVATNPSGEQYTDGLDIGVNYDVPAATMDRFGRLSVGANANVLFNYKFHPNPQSRNNQYARQYTSSTYGLGGSNGLLPSYVVKYHANWLYKGFSTSLGLSYTPSVVDMGSLFAGQAATNSVRADGKAYMIPSYTTADLTVSYLFQGRGWLNNIGVLAGVSNLTNKTAPFIPTGNEDNTDKRTYDIIGRMFFMEVSKKF